MNPPEIKTLSKEMEDKIMHSATHVFVLKGKAGTSMQDIANEAGINRTLLNYYFRSKDNLFEKVFSKLFSEFLPVIVNTLQSDLAIDRRIEKVIDYYFLLLIDNPVLPLFILQELTSNPLRLVNLIKNGGLNLNLILKSFEDEMILGNIKQMDPRELLINLMSLILFPFAARPIIEEIIFSGEKSAYLSFMIKRKESLKSSFIQSIKH